MAPHSRFGEPTGSVSPSFCWTRPRAINRWFSATFSPDGDGRPPCPDRTTGPRNLVRVWRSDGTGEPVVLVDTMYTGAETLLQPGRHTAGGLRLGLTQGPGLAVGWNWESRSSSRDMRCGSCALGRLQPGRHEGRDRLLRRIRPESGGRTGRVSPSSLRGHEAGCARPPSVPTARRVVTASPGTARLGSGAPMEAEQLPIVLRGHTKIIPGSYVWTPLSARTESQGRLTASRQRHGSANLGRRMEAAEAD